MLILSVAKYFNVYLFALASAGGMAVNDSISWLVGKNGDVVFIRNKNVMKMEKFIHKWGIGAVFLWALIPFPYDFIGVIAGYLELPYRKYVFSIFMARFIRFLLLGMGIIAISK